MDSDEYGCPRCKTTKYRNPSMKLLVNLCGHPLCSSCMEVIFVKGSGPCPDCGIILRRGGFREQLFDDPFVEREVDIRKKILKDYCKTEKDFATLREYNDYLEEIENIVFSLAKNIDTSETQKKIEQYRKENADQIKRARILGNPHIHELDEIIRQERLLADKRNYENTVLEKAEVLRRQKTKESLIDNLMFSDTDANSILTQHKLKTEQDEIESKALLEAKTAEFLAAAAAVPKTTTTTTTVAVNKPGFFSTGLSIRSGPSQATPVVPAKEELFSYDDVDLYDADIPTLDDIVGKKYVTSWRGSTEDEVAGGYHVSKSVHRSLLDILSTASTQFDPTDDGHQFSDVEQEEYEYEDSMDTNN